MQILREPQTGLVPGGWHKMLAGSQEKDSFETMQVKPEFALYSKNMTNCPLPSSCTNKHFSLRIWMVVMMCPSLGPKVR